MEYTIKAVYSKGNGHRWTIKGLEDRDPLTEEIEGPDTVLWLMGMEHACDTPESIGESMYCCLYDLYQVRNDLKDGDIFRVEAATVNKYHHYDVSLGTVDVPAMVFACDGVHVVKVQNCENCGHEFIKDSSSQTICPQCTGKKETERKIERIGEGGTFERIESEFANEYSVDLLIHFADGTSAIFSGVVDDEFTVQDLAISIDADQEMNDLSRVVSYEVCF